MAARLNPPPVEKAEIIDLRRLSARDLEPLLREETAVWREELDWDFEKSADLVRRFVDLRALNGSGLVVAGRIAGYLYYVLEESKGLIGDLYLHRAAREVEHENLLLEWALDAMWSNPYISRIESQLLMLDYAPGRVVPRRGHTNAYERNFMRADLRTADLREGVVRRPMYVEKWSDLYQEPAAQLIAAAYAGHVDSLINDQYRSVGGARRFLFNIVQYPGCGNFYPPASYGAFEALSARLCGVSLASLVAADCGHITQICVSPDVRGTGIGHELLRRSMTTLRDMGCRYVSLTVTAANAEAVSLYERVGFRTVRRFGAYVWERG